jgi:hypothetical protein
VRIIISIYDGIRSKWTELEENTYLHSIKENYQYAESINPYHHVINTIRDDLWSEVIKAQEKREIQLLNTLIGSDDYSTVEDGAKKLSEWVFQYGGVNDLITQDTDYIKHYLENILTEALNQSSINGSARATQDVLVPLYDEVEQLLYTNMTKYRANIDKDLMRYVDDNGIGLEMAHKMRQTLERYGTKSGTIFNQSVESYIKELSNSNALSDFKGAALEGAITYSLNHMLSILNKHKNIEVITSADFRAGGRAIKADNLIVSKGEIDIPFGISDKTTKITTSTGGARIKLNDEGSLQNFLKNLQSIYVYQNDKGTQKMRQLGNELDNNNLKYHLINQTFFSKGNMKATDPYNDIISAIKNSIFMFIGGQFVKYADSVNVDFMNINGHFVPVSSIMKGLDDQKQSLVAKAKPDLGYKEPRINEEQLLKEKKKTPVQVAENFYSNEALHAGKQAGEKIWKAIYLKRIVLSLKIKDLI